MCYEWTCGLHQSLPTLPTSNMAPVALVLGFERSWDGASRSNVGRDQHEVRWPLAPLSGNASKWTGKKCLPKWNQEVFTSWKSRNSRVLGNWPSIKAEMVPPLRALCGMGWFAHTSVLEPLADSNHLEWLFQWRYHPVMAMCFFCGKCDFPSHQHSSQCSDKFRPTQISKPLTLQFSMLKNPEKTVKNQPQRRFFPAHGAHQTPPRGAGIAAKCPVQGRQLVQWQGSAGRWEEGLLSQAA